MTLKYDKRTINKINSMINQMLKGWCKQDEVDPHHSIVDLQLQISKLKNVEK